MMLKTREAAEFLGVKANSLNMARSRGLGCPYRRKNGAIVYDKEDLTAYKTLRRSFGGNERARLYVVRSYEGEEMTSIMRRRGRSFEDACDSIRAYPSFANCTFTEGRKTAVNDTQAKSLRAAWRGFEAAYRQLEKTVNAILTAEPTGAE